MDTATFAWFERKELDVDTMRERIEATVKAKVHETCVLREQAEREAQRAAERLSRVKRDYMDGKLGADDWAMFREELNTEADAAIGQAQQLAQREHELSESLRSATENQVASELAELRAAIAGHIDAAQGLDEVRFRLRALFQSFTLTAAGDGAYLQAELASGVLTTLNVDRLSRFMEEWRAQSEKTEVEAFAFYIIVRAYPRGCAHAPARGRRAHRAREQAMFAVWPRAAARRRYALRARERRPPLGLPGVLARR